MYTAQGRTSSQQPWFYETTSYTLKMGRKLVPETSGILHILALLSAREYLIVVHNIIPLNAKLNPICYLLALIGAHHFLHVSRIRIKIWDSLLYLVTKYLLKHNNTLSRLTLSSADKRSVVF